MQIISLILIKQCILRGKVNFANNEKSVLKWCLNRPEQWKNTYLLKDMASVRSNDSPYTAIRPSRILHSEKLVTSVTEVLQQYYLNPFSRLLDTQQLYNISSGVPVKDRCQVLHLLTMRQTGIELRDCFIQDRLVSGVTSFHRPIKINNLKLFTSNERTAKMKIGRETSILEINHNIMTKNHILVSKIWEGCRL